MREELENKANGLGINIDGRWSDERLANEVAKAEKPAVALIQCEVLRAIWDENAHRIDVGSIISLPVDLAMDYVENQIVKRVKASA